MSRTTLCVLTAALLALGSLGVMATRRHVLGDEVRRPAGPNTWKVTLAVQGISQGGATLVTSTPLELDRQQVLDDSYESPQLTPKPPEARHPERRQVLWTQRGAAPDGPFRARCEFHVAVDGAGRGAPGLYAAPRPGEYLQPLPGGNDERLSATARGLTADLEPAHNHRDIAEALYRFVAGEVRNEPGFDGPPATPLACLESRRGDRPAKARLLLALLRDRGIPARLVAGLVLGKSAEQRPHYWVEAWVYGHWLPMCPFHGYFGRLPPTYLVFGFGDKPLVRGRHVKDLDFAFLVERVAAPDPAAGASPLRRLFTTLSLYLLPPAERRLVEVLLLLPLAALIICVFRNLVGLSSFGMFAPALIGLAFHDLHSLPGLLVFVTIVLIGWLLRRLLDRFHLLQVPRVALMLTLIMVVLIAAIVAANRWGAPATRYISLFPVVILTGMVERFWTLETEDSTTASFKTLFQTMLISTVIALVLGRQVVVQHFFRYPETLGLVMAAQLLIGRYTGYRLMELFRFRDFLRPPLSPLSPWGRGVGGEGAGYTVAVDR
jgi:transglutaminase-like putative cysteine protease